MIIVSGILSTLAMTVFVRTISAFLHQPFYVIKILSTMIQFGNQPTARAKTFIYAVATSLHYVIGIAFTYVFFEMVDQNILSLQLRDALLFGIIIGAIGIAGWRIFFALHPDPVRLDLVPFLTTIWLGHVVLGIALHFCLQYGQQIL